MIGPDSKRSGSRYVTGSDVPDNTHRQVSYLGWMWRPGEDCVLFPRHRADVEMFHTCVQIELEHSHEEASLPEIAGLTLTTIMSELRRHLEIQNAALQEGHVYLLP